MRTVPTPDVGNVPSVPKAEFLRSVRQTLGRGEGPPAALYHRLEEDLAELESRSEELKARLLENRPATLDRFCEMAVKGGWNLHRAAGVEEAIGHVATLASELGVSRAVRSSQPVFDDAPVDAALESRGIAVTPIVGSGQSPRETLREEIRRAGLGLTGADYALAETGSVIVLPRRGLSRLVSLVPPVHVALVRPLDVLESLDDLFLLRRLEYYRRNGEMGSYLNFITGPSRTADIEMTIVQGVHGPKSVHLVLVE